MDVLILLGSKSDLEKAKACVDVLKEFEDKCVLVGHPKMVNVEYIKQSLDAWTFMFDKDEAEFDAHYDLSRQLERKQKRKKKPLQVITTKEVIEY